MLQLEIQDGAARRTVMVSGPEARIGRDPEVEVLLSGDASVSRVHAFLRTTTPGWVLVDAGSRNGTRVNGQRLAVPHLLVPGDRVSIGQFVLVPRSGDEDRYIETVAADQVIVERIQRATGLSPREIEVLRQVATGATDEAIAQRLFISVKTVHSHLDRLRDKTGLRRRPELIRFAMEHGLD